MTPAIGAARTTGLASVLLVVLAACATRPPPAPSNADTDPTETAGDPATGRCPAHPAQTALTTLNLVRSDRGLVPLRPERRLEAAARIHALDLQRNGSRGHEGSDGSLPQERATRENYPWIRIGENVATGFGSASTVVARWMRSPAHRDNILTPEFREAGVAWVAGDSVDDAVWVLVLGRRRAAPQDRPGCVGDGSSAPTSPEGDSGG